MYKQSAIVLCLVSGMAWAQADVTTDIGASGEIDASEINLGIDSNLTLEEQFEAVDADGDGAISRTEAKGNAELASMFGSMDESGDGSLSKAEFMAGLRAGAEAENETETESEAEAGEEAAADTDTSSGSQGSAEQSADAATSTNTGASIEGSASTKTEAESEGFLDWVSSWFSSDTEAEASAR